MLCASISLLLATCVRGRRAAPGGRAAPTAALGCGLGASARSRACTQYGLRLYRVLFRPPEQCVLSKLECAWKLNQRDPRCVVWIVARDARLARALTRYSRAWLGYGTVDMVAAGCCAWGACSVVVHHVVHGRCAGRRTGHRPGARIRRARRRRAYVCVRSIVYEVWRVRARRGRKKTRAGDDSTRTVKSDAQQPMKTVWRLPKHAPCDYLPFTPR